MRGLHPMRVHVLQHVPFEGPGSIAAWLTARQEVVTTTRLFEAGAVLPPVSAFDVLIVLGGPMSANDEAALPWLRPEKRLLRKAIRSGKAVLGICLGAQLMAAALGARVYPAQHKEIGWFPVQGCAPQGGGFVFPATAEVFHWHGETFDLPDGAIHLARSTACPHQAFQIGQRAIGLQFHLETTPDSVAAMLAHCHGELVPSPFIQTAQALQARPPGRYEELYALMDQLLRYLTRSTSKTEAFSTGK